MPSPTTFKRFPPKRGRQGLAEVATTTSLVEAKVLVEISAGSLLPVGNSGSY